MKTKIVNILDSFFIFLIFLFVIIAPLFNGIYREIHINYFILILFIMNVIGIFRTFLSKLKINKIYILLILFSFSFLIPYFCNTSIFNDSTIKSFLLTILIVLLSFNTINVFEQRQNKFIKFIIVSTTICSIISMVSIFFPTFFNSLQIYNRYGDFYKTSVDRLYGTLLYPNVLALYNLIGIVLSMKFMDKKIYKFVIYINLLCLFLTISKSIILFLLVILLIFRKNYKFLIALFLPLLFNIGLYRNMYMINNLIIFVLATILLFILTLIINNIVEKHEKKYTIIILSVLIFSLLIGGVSLTVERKNEEIVVADLMGLKNNTNYTLEIETEGDNNGIIFLKKYFIFNNELNYILERSSIVDDKISINFYTDNNFEFYNITLNNYSGKNKIKSIELKSDNITKEIPVNYFIFPYNYVTMFSQVKYDVTSLEGRSSIYKDSIRLIKENLFTGKGNNAFKQFTIENNKAHKAIEEHSYLLRMGVENGIFSMIIWLIIIFCLVINCLRSYKDENYLYFSIVVVLIILSSLYDFTLSYGLFLYLLFTFATFLKPVTRKDILCICSAGGHLTSMNNIKPIYSKYDSILITEKNEISKKIENCEYVLYCSKYYLLHYLLVLPINIILNIYYFVKYNPKIIISTGAHTGVFMCYIGKLFKKKIIFIEVFDRYKTLTLSGKMIYFIADKFIVQHKELITKYPKSIYIGGMY